MKRIMIFALCLWPAIAFAQKTYTNADLVDIEVPGAYTNEDLRQLPPLAIQSEPAARLPRITIPPVDSAPYQAAFDDLSALRRSLQAELDYENGAIAFSRSGFAGRAQGPNPRLGYEARVAGLVRELIKRIALVDGEIERLLDVARRAGAVIDQRYSW
jgi:hypothetical protein